MTLAIISGLSALWFGAGLAAAALPLIAHLLSRRGGPTIDFPAVRFVRIAAAEQAARDRPRDVLLLALRILIVALIALAFDRPVWSSSAAPSSDPGAGEDVVIVLDASASMSRTDHARGRTLFQIARDRALDELAAAAANGSRVGIVVASLAPEALLPRLSDQHQVLADRLGALEVTLQRADIPSALALASALPALDEDRPRTRRIVVFSDMQASAWTPVTSAPAGVTLDLRLLGPGASTANLAIADIEITPPRPIVGRQATVSAKVTNYSDAPARPTIACATLDADAEWSDARAVTPNLAPGASTTVSFPLTFSAAVQTPVRVALVDTGFTHDDAAFLVAEVRDARRVALITASPDEARDGAFFLEAALAPTPDAEFAVTRLAPAQATAAMLASFDAIAIAQAGALPDSAHAAILAALDAGLGVLWLLDSQPAYESAAAFGAESGALPVSLTGRFTRLAGSERRDLAAGEFDAGPLMTLQGPASRALLDASFSAVAPADPAPGGIALLSFDTGEPFVAWRATPRGGRIMALCADLHPDANTLVKGPMFPVLAHELVRFLLPASGGLRPAEVGENLVSRIDHRIDFAEPVADDLRRPARVTRGGANFDALLSAPPDDAPGVTPFRDASARAVAYAAANLAPQESDLRALDEPAIADLLAADARDLRVATASPGGTLARRAIELWPWLIAAAVAMLTVESLLAGPARRRLSEGGA